MKIYKFYYKADIKDISVECDDGSILNTDDYIQHKYPLYAFTNKKKLYKEFKEERNMDNFIIIKNDIDKEDFADFAECNRNAYIEKSTLKVKDENGKVYDMDFATTTYENIVIDEMDIEYIMGSPADFMPYLIFNDEIVKALKVLNYPFFYKLITGVALEEKYDDYDQVDVTNNDFEILCSQFSGTFY